MKIGDNIKLLLSNGILEEGIIENLNYISELDNSSCLVISHLNNPNKKLCIKHMHIIAYQIDSEFNFKKPIENKVLIVEDLSTNIPIQTVKSRLKKLAQTAISRGSDQRNIVREMIENTNLDDADNIKYDMPSFLKK